VSLTVQQITERLEAIEEETEKKSGPGERAAENHARQNREYELRYAKEFVKASGTPTKAQALVAVAADKELWNALVAAEASYEGWKAGMRSRELRTSIGQSLLKSQRELGG
jgi:hypothetical protein